MKECPACGDCFSDDASYCDGDGNILTLSIRGEPVLDGRYRLERRLGQGGMGVVYKAQHVFLKSTHAVKVILPDLVGKDQMLLTRFRQEAIVAASIRHKNIVAVTDFGVANGTMPFLVMELIKGSSLQDLLTEKGPLSLKFALEIMEAIVAGVSIAHRHGIIHRDLKPLNIMVDADVPISEAVKILDFGLAKMKAGDTLGSFVQAQTVGMMGSPLYMAPEQWSEEDVDKRTDIYSLGIILYQMLAGTTPFKGSSIPMVMKKHLMEDPPPFTTHGVPVPPLIESVAFRALRKKPAERPQSVEEFLTELCEAASKVFDAQLACTVAIPGENESLPAQKLTETQHKVEEEVERLVRELEEAQRRAVEARERVEEASRRRAEEEAARKRAEEEAARKRAEEEAARKRAEEEAQKRAEEEAARQLAEEEAQRKLAEEEAERRAAGEVARKLAEDERIRIAREVEEARLRAEEAHNLAEEEAQRRVKEEEARKLAEEKAERLARELEEAQQRVEEARQRAEEETRKHAEEEAARRRAEDEAIRLAAEVADAQRRAEELRQQRAEVEAERQAEIEAQSERTGQLTPSTDESARGEQSQVLKFAGKLPAEAEGENPRSSETANSSQLLQKSPAPQFASPQLSPYDTRPMFDINSTSKQQLETSSRLQNTAALAPGVTQRRSRALPATFAIIAALVLSGGGYAVYRRFAVEPPATTTGESLSENKTQAGSETLPAAYPNMIAIPGGTFNMGREDKPATTEDSYNQWPAHTVRVESFYIGRTEVSNSEYAVFLDNTNYARPVGWPQKGAPPGKELWPVTNVSLDDAQAFARWCSGRDGKGYRLPTEEEWEYAARGGSNGDLYPWGNEWDEGRANLGTGRGKQVDFPKPVGSYPQGATVWGVMDMIGNVHEWTSSTASFYLEDKDKVPSDQRGWIVIRGGSHQSMHVDAVKRRGGREFPATWRAWVQREAKDNTLGFRLARSGN